MASDNRTNDGNLLDDDRKYFVIEIPDNTEKDRDRIQFIPIRKRCSFCSAWSYGYRHGIRFLWSFFSSNE